MNNPTTASSVRGHWRVIAISLPRSVAAVRRAREHHAPAVEYDLAGVGGLRAILGQEALDGYHRARREILLPPPLTNQGARNAKLQGPGRDLAIGLGHLDVEPGMRVHPGHLHDLAGQRDALRRVELRGKLV